MYTVPLVVVEGFLFTTSSLLWGDFEAHLNLLRNKHDTPERKVIFAQIGPVSSLHDRACELFYALKGGTVDYGEAHSRQFGHARYGRHCSTGLYPSWSADYPLHFVGHSMGGTTVTTMLSMIRDGFFGPQYDPDMVLSITSVTAPFRGSQIVYTLGESRASPPDVRLFSLGSGLAKLIHVVTYLSPLLPKALLPDLHIQSRSLTYEQLSFSSFLSQLWRSSWAEGKDCLPYDCTFEAADERDIKDKLIKRKIGRTWLRSYVASVTQRTSSSSLKHFPCRSEYVNPVLSLSAYYIGQFDFSTLKHRHSKLEERSKGEVDLESGLIDTELDKRGDEYWENDGVVPVFSQWHPGTCIGMPRLSSEP